MDDGRKRSAPPGDSPSTRTRQRFRPPNYPDARRRNMTKAIAAVLVVLGVFMTGGATPHAPTTTRAPIFQPHRPSWAEVREELRRRKAFRRTFRMPEESFVKLADLLRPLLQNNEFYGRLRCSKHGAIEVEIRLGIGLRMLAGGSYLDVASRFGVSHTTVYSILWDVVDAINNTPEVGPFFFPQTVAECRVLAARFKAKSYNGIFDHVVAATDGLMIKMKAPPAKSTSNTVSYFSGSKTGYGFNVQATCDADYRFCSISIISPGAANDWNAWTQSSLAQATGRLPDGYHIIGDAAYPISETLLTPYPGKGLPKDKDSFNFHLSQLRVKIEQSFGILVSTWGILWKPLGVAFAGRTDMIVAIFHLHNFCRDEHASVVAMEEEDDETGEGRIGLTGEGALPPAYKSVVQPTDPQNAKPLTRSGETPTRAALAAVLLYHRQFRPKGNIDRNA